MPLATQCKDVKTPHNPFVLCFTNSSSDWKLYFYVTSRFKSWSTVNLTQTRLANNAQLHQSLSNFVVFPFMIHTNSHYITFVTACWSSYLPSKLAELLDPHMLKVERGKKKKRGKCRLDLKIRQGFTCTHSLEETNRKPLKFSSMWQPATWNCKIQEESCPFHS